jgi:hypothetical protein
MKTRRRFVLDGVLAAAALAVTPAMAQDKKDAKAPAKAAEKSEKGKSTVKVHVDNDKVRVTERTYKPGDTNEEAPTSFYRVNRTLKGGTLERTYADGKKEKLELKDGQVRFIEPGKGAASKYTVKNIGTTEVVSFVVQLK